MKYITIESFDAVWEWKDYYRFYKYDSKVNKVIEEHYIKNNGKGIVRVKVSSYLNCDIDFNSMQHINITDKRTKEIKRTEVNKKVKKIDVEKVLSFFLNLLTISYQNYLKHIN